MRHRAVRHQPLHVILRQRRQATPDHPHDADAQHCELELLGGAREVAQADPDQAIAAHLQQDPGQQHRHRRGSFDMRVGQPGVEREGGQLDRKTKEEEPEQRARQRRRQPRRGERLHVECVGAGLEVQDQDREQQEG